VGAPLSEPERLARLRLARSESVGPLTFLRLIERFGDAAAALAALPELARRGGRGGPLRIASAGEAERELAAAARAGARLLCWGEPDYPEALAAIDDPPVVLTVLGDVALLSRPAVALVGARNASLAGRRLAEAMARELAGAGLTVASGLARGIDGAAHAGALAVGRTVAVMAGGADVVYPPEHRDLHRRIAVGGAVVAEMPLGSEPQARHFPRRNRVISGLSRGVVVIEAALRSGSLITARMALEQGREVMAVPGSPLDARARGCNRLIKQGATLVEEAADVLAQLGTPLPAGTGAPISQPASWPEPARAGLAAGPEVPVERAHDLILMNLSATPVLIDELVRACQLSPAAVSAALLELELAGRIQRHPGGQISLG
jgi:DNA processing protein